MILNIASIYYFYPHLVFGIKLDSKLSKAQLFSQMYLYCK